MICHRYKCVFIHIPKNAGQSIEHVFLELLNLTWETRAPLLLRPNDKPELGPPRLAHLHADEYVRYDYMPQEMYDDYFKFTFVRNPWSRIISIYKHLGFNRKCDFKTFLMGVFSDTIFNDKHWFVGPQCEYVCAENGDFLPNFVGRFEDLQNGFNHVCQEIGLSAIQLPHANKSGTSDSKFGFCVRPMQLVTNILRSISKKTIPSYDRYQDYYDQESIEFVGEIYKKDIELFGYQFE